MNPAPISHKLKKGVPGSVDGIDLYKQSVNYYHPIQKPLKKGAFFVPQGAGYPLKREMIFHKIPDDSMFLYAKNHASPECCPSAYSTSAGCVCITPEQQKFVAQRRGNNKNYPDDSF